MNVNYLDSLLNSTFVEVFAIYWGNFLTYTSEIYLKIIEPQTIRSVFEDFPESLYFDDFQWSLLKAFTFILVINLFLIFVAWKVYRKTVCERFMKPVTSKAIEELKASVSRLKLPKEHTPRI